jgi:hypothetical protein
MSLWAHGVTQQRHSIPSLLAVVEADLLFVIGPPPICLNETITFQDAKIRTTVHLLPDIPSLQWRMF